jgi:hypothetical protein
MGKERHQGTVVEIPRSTDSQGIYGSSRRKKLRNFIGVEGEPLMWKIHWEAMKRIVELGIFKVKVLARYNSNMSRIDFLQ